MPQSETMISVLGDFEVTDTAVGQSPDSAARWIPAVVPGGVYESLLAAGRIPHPYSGTAEADLRWVEDRDWWYRTSFDSPPGFDTGVPIRLVFHGLDTVVDIWLNELELGHHENMFRPAEFDVTGLLRPQNQLLLRFKPPLAGLEMSSSARELRDKLAALFAQSGRDTADDGSAEFIFEDRGKATLRRKPIFSWGWDFAPRLPSIGIWQPVELVCEEPATLTGYHLQTLVIDREASTAEVKVTASVRVGEEMSDLAVVVVLTSPDGRQTRQRMSLPGSVGEHEASVTAVVEEVSLWWTHDLGEPALYDLEVLVLRADKLMDSLVEKAGIRTILLDRSSDTQAGGYAFRFVLNGEPIFARGAAYLPDSMFVGTVNEERQRSLISMACDAGMNMLRVWGGGLYESDGFYQTCDELGLLVWQDFMFACIDYPSDDPTLYNEVAREAEYQVRRLRNHPCLALWAGNNEVHLLHQAAYRSSEPGNWGYRFFHQLLPDVVARHSPGVDYWPGSPYGETDPGGVNGVSDGDRHAWEVWHGIDFGVGDSEEYPNRGEAMHFHRYSKDTGKFVSEFGILAAPTRSTLERWLPSEALTLDSSAFRARIKDTPRDKVLPLLEVETGLPTDLDSYIQKTMVVQAEGLKYGIEHYRRRQPHNGGTLIWQLNDVWPGISWSIIDYSLLPKAAYYFVRRAFSTAIASFRCHQGELELWISNSGRNRLEDEVVVEILSTATGQSFAEQQLTIKADPWSSQCVWSSAIETPDCDKVATVHSTNNIFPDNRLFFTAIKDLRLGSPNLAMAVIETNGDGSATVEVTASSYAYLVQLSSADPEVHFDNNYFDVSPVRGVRVSVHSLGPSYDLANISLSVYAHEH
jgi:beta-mannosidase